MTLSDWVKNGWLVPHQPSRKEVSGLVAIVERDLADSETKALSADWKLNIAYNAALQAATLALHASGYRASRGHHYRVIQSLQLTIGADAGVTRRLDAFRKKRNFGEYEGAGGASETEAREMRELARKIRDDVGVWLKKVHPELLK
jgi:hypothetical protein